MCAGFLYKLLKDLRIFQHGTWTEHIVVKRLIIVIGHKQRLFQYLKNGILPDVSIGIMDKYTGLCVSVCINMEVISSSCNAASNKLTIVLKIHGKKSGTMFHISDLSYPVVHVSPLFYCGKQFRRSLISNWHIMEIQRIPAAFFHQHLNKLIACNAFNILACITDGGSEYKTVFFQKLHGMHNLSVNTLAPAKIIDFRFSFKTERKKKISCLLHLTAQFLIHKSTVGIGQKNTVIMLFAESDHVFFTYKRLSACKHIKISPQFFSLRDHRVHFVKGQIQFISILRCPASGTVQVTGTCRIH